MADADAVSMPERACCHSGVPCTRERGSPGGYRLAECRRSTRPPPAAPPSVRRADGGVLPAGEPDALQLHKGPERLDVGPIVPLQLVVASVGVHSHRLDAARRLGSEPIVAEQHVELQADLGAKGVSQQLVGIKCAHPPPADGGLVASRRQSQVIGRIVKDEAPGVLESTARVARKLSLSPTLSTPSRSSTRRGCTCR